MNTKILVIVLGTLAAAATAETASEPTTTETSFVPGVFISADALKSLQEKAKQPDSNVDIQTEPPKVSKKSDQVPDNTQPEQVNPGYTQNQPIQGQQQINPPMSNQQNYLNNPTYSNQPLLNQPPYNNQQPIQFNQQPSYNQQLGYQQPATGYQQPGYVQSGYQQPGYQQNGMNQPYVTNPQGILVAQQPRYQNPQGMLVNQQPSFQQPMLVAQQPNQQLFIPNGQIGQPNMVANPNLSGQPLIGNNPINGGMVANPAQGQGNMYAIVPINGQNAVPNPNLGNNNAYFVPVQQIPPNGVVLNNGK